MTAAERKLRKDFKALTDKVKAFLAALDREMKQPSSPERGSRIANLANALNMANDSARRYGLDIKDF